MTTARHQQCAPRFWSVVDRAVEPWGDRPHALADEPGRVWSRAYADELRGPPLSPAFYTLTPFHGFPEAHLALHGESAGGLDEHFRYAHASAYIDVELLGRIHAFHPKALRSRGLAEMFPPAVRDEFLDRPWRWRGRLRRHVVMELLQRDTRSVRNVAARAQKAAIPFTEAFERLARVELSVASDADIDAHLDAVRHAAAGYGALCGDAVMYHAADLRLLLVALLDRWFGDGERHYAAVSSGLTGMHTTAEADRIWTLAQAAAEDTAVLEALRTRTPWPGLAALASNSEAGRRFLDDLEAFRRDHAHRGASYKDVVHPRFGDDPELLVGAIRGQLHARRAPSAANEAAARTRHAVTDRLLGSLGGPLGRVRRRILRTLLDLNAVYAAMRDDHRFHFDRVWMEHRRVLLVKGERLHQRGLLPDPEDVFFLGARELDGAWRNGTPTDTGAIDRRRETWEHTRTCSGPPFLQGTTSLIHGGGSTDLDVVSETFTLVGTPASAGSVRGIAHVILDVRDLDRVPADGIVVTRQTDPSWSPAFARIAGLVLETGSVLAHGASLCREYALPCVTGVSGAVERISDGVEIRLDGSAGVVEILQPRSDHKQEGAPCSPPPTNSGTNTTPPTTSGEKASTSTSPSRRPSSEAGSTSG